MRHYAQYDEKGKLIAVGEGYGGTEITQEEYNTMLTDIIEKAELTDKLYRNEITPDDIPVDWKEEIQSRVDERKAEDAETAEREISADEALNIILGGENT